MDAKTTMTAGAAMPSARTADAEERLARFDAFALGFGAFLGNRAIGHLLIERLQVGVLDGFLELREIDAKVRGELLKVGLAVLFRRHCEGGGDLADLAVA